MTDLSQVVWRKSSHSGANGCVEVAAAAWRKSSRSNGSGACVEVATNLTDLVAVRDSKDPHGPVLTVTAADWRTFVAALRR
jgi:hypothetical protein